MNGLYCDTPVHHVDKTVPCCLFVGHEGRHVPSKLRVANGFEPLTREPAYEVAAGRPTEGET